MLPHLWSVMPGRGRQRPWAALVATAGLLVAMLTVLMPGAASATVTRADRAAAPVRDRSVPVRQVRSGPTGPFTMVGFTWREQPAAVTFRVLTETGWSDWLTADPLPGTQGTDLSWVGSARSLQALVTRGSGVRVVLIDSRVTAGDRQQVVHHNKRRARRHHRVPRPHLRSRADWGAKERWRTSAPRYNRRLKQVHVHHTASGNDYRRRDVPAIIRGIYRYHTKYLGWSDIGYNFLVDRYGRIWTGRRGGAKNRVRGAHTLGFNRASTGVAVIGNTDTRRPGRKVLRGLVRLAAWKLDRAGRNPRGHVRVRSEGSDLFAPGRRVRLPVIDGHRDTNQTSCPGDRLYRKLGWVRRHTAKRIKRFRR